MTLALLIACAKREEPRSTHLAAVNADLQKASKRFREGSLSGRDYLQLSSDRAGKARRYRDDPMWREVAQRDSDGDRVPDRYDRCKTPELQATDEKGCPMPPASDCDRGDPRCGPTATDDRNTRQLNEEIKLMFNASCEGAPKPQTPDPLEWGRGRGAPGAVGFNVAVTKVSNQQPACELFYEVEARAGNPPANPVRYTTALFKASEDLKKGDPRVAMFNLPMPEDIPLPAGRNDLRWMFSLAEPVQWRVRAVNGAQAMSSWSQVRTQGPASGGVDPGP